MSGFGKGRSRLINIVFPQWRLLSVSSLDKTRVFVSIIASPFVFYQSSWGSWWERQWHNPKGPEPGMLRFISPPFSRIKYHSSYGLHPAPLCVCVTPFVYVARFVYHVCVQAKVLSFLSARQGYGFCLCYCEDTCPCCLPSPYPPTPVHQVTWVLWAVSRSIISCGWLSGQIRMPCESNADELRQFHSDWEGSSGPSTICNHPPPHLQTHTNKQIYTHTNHIATVRGHHCVCMCNCVTTVWVIPEGIMVAIFLVAFNEILLPKKQIYQPSESTMVLPFVRLRQKYVTENTSQGH